MRLFTYIIVHDTGFAPNPFWRYCTLACCKPVIRRTAAKGDWIVGISPKNSGNRLIYAMKVTEELSAWPEASSRRREWVSRREARRRVDEAEPKAILATLDR